MLLAEDDDELRQLIAEVLRMDGFDVVEIPDGTALMMKIESQLLKPTDETQAVDVIITDLKMPGPSGIDSLPALRQNDWATPCIIITAYCDDRTQAAAEDLGIHLIKKPFELDDLRTAVLNFT